MTRRLLGSYLLLTLVVLLALEVPLAIGYRDHEIDSLKAGLQRDAFVLSSYVSDALQGVGDQDLQTVVDNYTSDTGGRAVIVDANGDVLADSDPATDGQRNFASRPEIADALERRISIGTRYSNTLGTSLLYVAVPVSSGTRTLGALRLSFSTAQVDAKVRRYWELLAGAGLVTLAIAGGIGLLLAKWVTGPVADLRDAAVRIGNGNLAARAKVNSGPPEIRDLAASFNATAIRLQQLVTAQEQFVADASHQLRTPLTALRLRLEMIAEDGDASIAEDIEAATTEVQRLARLVDGLLSLARAERTASSRPDPIDLDSQFEERRAVWQPVADDRGVTIEVERSGLRARITADSLSQVLDNYLANALEVVPRGSVITITAEHEQWRTDAPVSVHVIDEGPGMSFDERERAFDRFWRATGEKGELGGSGLGLAIVQKLAQAEGGSAELRAAPGGGLDAVVLLRV